MRSIASLPCKIVWFDTTSFQEIFYHQGFFAVKQRAVFILGAKWIALVRGWRRDCAVGDMETRFQWRKAHNSSTKCEAFHFASRLFFMFLFLIPFTIRQHCIIYPQKFSAESKKKASAKMRTPVCWKMGADITVECILWSCLLRRWGWACRRWIAHRIAACR